jgi:hypothetical protein
VMMGNYFREAAFARDWMNRLADAPVGTVAEVAA